MIPINLINNKYGRLKVLKYDFLSKGTGHAKWICQCECGNKLSVRAGHLKSGNAKSCGCLAKEIAKKLLTAYSRSIKHIGEGNPQWKGDKTKHSAIHTWLSRHYKKKKCDFCLSIKHLDWALKNNLKHTHSRDNYHVLCRSCHMKYDYRNKTRRI